MDPNGLIQINDDIDHFESRSPQTRLWWKTEAKCGTSHPLIFMGELIIVIKILKIWGRLSPLISW